MPSRVARLFAHALHEALAADGDRFRPRSVTLHAPVVQSLSYPFAVRRGESVLGDSAQTRLLPPAFPAPAGAGAEGRRRWLELR